MPTSYVDEIVARFYLLKGYFISQGVWFMLGKKKGNKQGNWTDIDILAINHEELLIIQCKSFLGTGKAEKSI